MLSQLTIPRKVILSNLSLAVLFVFLIALPYMARYGLTDITSVKEDFLYSSKDEFRNEGWYSTYSPYKNNSLFNISQGMITLENNETHGDSWFYLNVEDMDISRWKIRANATWTGRRQPFPIILARTYLHLYVFAFYGGNDPKLYLWVDYATVDIFVGFKLTANVPFTFSFQFDDSSINFCYNKEIEASHELEVADPTNLKEMGFGTGWNSETKFDYVSLLYEIETGDTVLQQLDQIIKTIESMILISLLHGAVAFYTLFRTRRVSSALFVIPIILCALLWFAKLPEYFMPIPFIGGAIIAVGLFVKKQTERGGLTDTQLKEQTLELARSIAEYVLDRRRHEPTIDFNDWEGSTERIIAYSSESMNTYYVRFGSKVSQLREEFLRRGIRDREFEMFYSRPTNYIGLQTLALRLAALAARL